MDQIQENKECYTLPFITRTSFRRRMHILFLFLIILFIGFASIPADYLLGMFFRLFLFASGLFLAYCWVYLGILKKAFLELTEEGITLKTIFHYKMIQWIDIAYVRTYYLQGNLYIGIVSNQKLIIQKDNILTSLSNAFGGGYSLSIPLQLFPAIESQKLYSTIFFKAKEMRQQKENKEVDPSETIIEERKEKVISVNPVKSLFHAFFVSLTSGIIYGFCIYQFNINFLIIPLMGMMGIMHVFFKNCQKNDLNFIIRFGLGFLCAMQFFIALLVILLILNPVFVEANGAFQAVIICTAHIFTHPGEFISYYLFAAICFFFGAFQGYSSKTTRRIRKIFMRKQNGFIIKKDKRYCSIFLVDYVKYRENADKIILSIIPNTCLIEKEKNYIWAFYIPEQVILDFNINMNRLERAFVKGEMYYKLNLGGRTEPQPYGYMCRLILNKYRKVEVIQLETD